MLSHKSEQGEEIAQGDGFCLDEELKSLDTKDFYNLVQNLIRKNPEVHRLVLEWFKEKAKTSRVAEKEILIVSRQDIWLRSSAFILTC